MNAFSMFSCVVATVVCAAAGVAQDQEGWRLVPGPGPSARQLPAVAYDTVRKVAVLFGGGDANGVALNDTWEFDGRQWTQRSTAHAPMARYGHGMAYDAGRGAVVMFGGGDAIYFGDTWEYDGTDWHQRAPLVSPTPRYGTAMAFDHQRGRSVLFGGLGTNGQVNAEMWEWDGESWWLMSNNAIPGRRHHAMCWSARQNAVMVVGGLNNAQLRLGDTGYYFGGGGWNYLGNITPRTGSSMCENPITNLVVLTGGSLLAPGPTIVADNLMYGDTYPGYSPRSTLPEALSYHVSFFDERRQQVVVFGGLGPSGLSDRTYAYCANDTIATWHSHPISSLSSGDAIDIAIGRFDGDARPDVAALFPAEDRLAVFTNPGTTIFDWSLQPAATISLNAGADATSVAFGQIVSGGSEELVVACPGRNQVDIVTGSPTPTVQSVGVGGLLLPVHALVGDLDGTATGDIVVACRGSLTNRGGVAVVHDLGLSVQTITTTAFAKVERVAVADLDGDGDLDVAALGHGAQDGVWLLANVNGVLVNAGFVGLPGSNAATDLAAIDGDRDGDVDLLVSSSALFPVLDNRLVLLTNTEAAPLAPTAFASTSLPLKTGFTTRIAVGHRDGSLRLPGFSVAFVDALAGNSQLLDWVGESGFGTARVSQASGVGRVVLGDLNGDGCDDWVSGVAGGSLNVQWTLPKPRVFTYGSGCVGSYGLRPNAFALPNSSYVGQTILYLRQAYPQSAAVLMLDLAPGNIPIGGGCSVLLDNPLLLTYALTDAVGRGVHYLYFPPTVAGYDIFAQWAVLDPNGSYANLLALSNGVQVQMGY